MREITWLLFIIILSEFLLSFTPLLNALIFRVNDDCVNGIKCHCNEMLKAFVLGLSKAIREEMAIYGQISDEEWEIIRPSKKDRRDGILESMLSHLRKTSRCSNCTVWKVETADIWGSRYEASNYGFSASGKKHFVDAEGLFKLINAGFWKPFEGLVMNDVLFPHV